MAHRVLEVTLLSAKDLKNVNLITRMEVYAVATISGDPITRQCTPPDPHGGRNPTWNATLRFDVPATAEEARGGCLHVLLRAERMFGGDRDVGEVIVPLAEVLTGGGLGAPTSPRFASYQVCKVHRSETRGLLYLTYRLGPVVVPPPPPGKPADGWPVVGYPAQQVTPSSPATPTGHGDGPFSPAKPAAGYADMLPSPKPYGYGTTPAPSPRPTAQVVSMTTSPKPIGRVVSMPPSTKPVEHVVSMPPSPKPAGRAVSMPPSPRSPRHEVPMPSSPKSAGGHVSSPKSSAGGHVSSPKSSAGGYVPSSLKPSVHAMPPSPKPDTSSMAAPSSPNPSSGYAAMPSSPKPFGGHASVPPSPAPCDQMVGERIFTMTDVYRCPIVQRGAAATPN